MLFFGGDFVWKTENFLAWGPDLSSELYWQSETKGDDFQKRAGAFFVLLSDALKTKVPFQNKKYSEIKGSGSEKRRSLFRDLIFQKYWALQLPLKSMELWCWRVYILRTWFSVLLLLVYDEITENGPTVLSPTPSAYQCKIVFYTVLRLFCCKLDLE